jgi:hypothetical protein
MLHKLHPEEISLIRDLMSHDGFKYLLQEIEGLVEYYENDIIKLSVDATNEKELYLRKVRADGARKLADALGRRLQSLKGSS